MTFDLPLARTAPRDCLDRHRDQASHTKVSGDVGRTPALLVIFAERNVKRSQCGYNVLEILVFERAAGRLCEAHFPAKKSAKQSARESLCVAGCAEQMQRGTEVPGENKVTSGNPGNVGRYFCSSREHDELASNVQS